MGRWTKSKKQKQKQKNKNKRRVRQLSTELPTRVRSSFEKGQRGWLMVTEEPLSVDGSVLTLYFHSVTLNKKAGAAAVRSAASKGQKLLNWMFQHDCLDTYCFWVSYMHAFSIFVFAPVQRNWACFTWKSALEIRSLLLLLLLLNSFNKTNKTDGLVDGDRGGSVLDGSFLSFFIFFNFHSVMLNKKVGAAAMWQLCFQLLMRVLSSWPPRWPSG